MGNVIVSILFMFFSNLTVLFGQSNFIVMVEKINSSNYEESFEEGLFTITYDPGPKGVYLSVGATNLSNNNFGVIVSNLYLPGSDEVRNGKKMSVRFNLSALTTLHESNSIKKIKNTNPLDLQLFIHILTKPGFYPFDSSTLAAIMGVTVYESVDDAYGKIPSATPDLQISPVSIITQNIGDSKSDYRYRNDMPNIDLNSYENGISSSYAGDDAACAPAASANSMMWLANKYKDINFEEGISHRDILQDLSKFFKRENGKGTRIDEEIRGKLDFIESNNLPLEVKFQSFNDTANIASTSGISLARNLNDKDENGRHKPPSWSFIKEMIKTGEGVEIGFYWYNSLDKKWLGHAACMSGIDEYLSGVKQISFVHDKFQGGKYGTIEEFSLVNIDAKNFLRFGADNSKFILDIIAVSPIIKEGRETAAFINELFLGSGSNVAYGVNFNSNDLIEIVLNENISDLDNYKITLYDGMNGKVYQTFTLDQFNVGSTINGMVFYYKSVTAGMLKTDNVGISISHSGSVIQNQFLSYGGSFVAADGVAQAMTSTNIGIISSGTGIALSGIGLKYSDFSWETTATMTQGNPNPTQSFLNELNAPTSLTAEIGDSSNVVLNWIDNSGSESGFIIDRKINSDSYTILDSVRQNITTYNDTKIEDQTFYTYKIKAYNTENYSDYSNEAEILVLLTSIESSNVPTEYFIDQNYPNPFNPSTLIKFGIKNSENVKLLVYNTLGHKIAELVNNYLKKGIYSVQFNSSDLPSGIYLYQIRSGEFIKSKKMIMIK